ncbi:hypothetical protein BU15DRAFT_78146 [Melanogaster broomeanus]|nr:hypothetical protein BU15DRAFT_78146 [Melanogaster broomeanus]
MKRNGNDQRTSRVNEDSPRAPPEPPPPIIYHPEQSRDEAMKSNEPSSPQTSTDMHNGPGSEVAAPGDHGSERDTPASETKGRNVEASVPSQDTRPQPRTETKVEAGDDEGCRKGRSDRDGNGRDGRANDDAGATSNAGRESRRLAPKLLAEDEPNQHKNHTRTTRNVPEPSTPPMNCPKRPTESVNPPHRRGRLKTRPTRIRQARAHAGTRTRRIQHVRTLPGPIQLVGCCGYAPGMPGECPRQAKTKAEGPRVQHTRTARPHRQETRDAP